MIMFSLTLTLYSSSNNELRYIFSCLIKIHYFRDSSPAEDDVVFKQMPSVEDGEVEEDFNYDQETFDDDVSKESVNDNYDEEVSA